MGNSQLPPPDGSRGLTGDPLWYKDAIIYELHVRAFHDSSSDGMGDFKGLSQKLDYLQDLGVTALWLLPFSPSPWRDDGYDISDYTGVHPSYGTMRDFQSFLREAHRRGLRVITEIVVNHTSDQHPWFQRARRSPPGSKYRDFYVWSDSPDKYKEARIIFKDFETSNWTWDPVAKAYYWHRFYSHQPDLNFDSPYVREAVKDVAAFWLEMGVDGYRLDAIPYLYEREGTNCENLPETHVYLKELRSHVDQKFPGRMLLAEANQWPEDSIAYFGDGDECNMAFHFPLMPRLFMALRMEDRFPIIEIMDQTPAIPENCQWAIFLRNHDELTLEMVTDDERDYMYRMYAHDRQMRINLGIRRRLAPLLGNDRRKIELMNALLFSMPGTPVLYYGDEIGMGDNIYLGDRNGVRTPMQWSADRNAGFSRANPQQLYLPIIIDPEYHYEAVNVEGQQNNPHSLLWWMKRIIEQRKRHKAFGRGTLEFLTPSNGRVLAFVRRYEEETVLVVANLSRFPQHAQLDLSRFKGQTPVEMFGRAPFPAVTDGPYVITLGAYSFFWLSLEGRVGVRESIDISGAPAEIPTLPIGAWEAVLEGKAPPAMIHLLPPFLENRRWFLAKGRTILKVSIVDVIPVQEAGAYISILQIEYAEGDPDMYVMPASLALEEHAERVLADMPEMVFARVTLKDGRHGVIYSAMTDPKFNETILGLMARRRRLRGRHGEIAGSHTRAFRHLWGPDRPSLEPSPMPGEQRNTSVAFGDRFVFKLFRRIEPGLNPEVELSSFLAAREFPNAPALAGTLDYRDARGQTMSIGVLHGYVANQGLAWQFTLDSLGRFFERALSHGEPLAPAPLLTVPSELPVAVGDLLGEYAEAARLMGRRTGELHLSLASRYDLPDFAPEAFTDHYRHGLYHGFVADAGRALAALRAALPTLPDEVATEARKVLDSEEEIRTRYRAIRDRRFETYRIRIHGDLNLQQMLYCGNDFVLFDFEGMPSRAYGERRIKRSPLRDAAAMLRSIDYAAYAVLSGLIPGITPKPESLSALEHWAAFWSSWAGDLFLEGYLPVARESGLLPASMEDTRTLIGIYALERALAEASNELKVRPDWLIVPLLGIQALLRR
jgi:maltose alpha-D-glucosyltransferase / alpha-amylase